MLFLEGNEQLWDLTNIPVKSLSNNTDHNGSGSRVKFPGEIYPTSPQARQLKPLERQALARIKPECNMYE